MTKTFNVLEDDDGNWVLDIDGVCQRQGTRMGIYLKPPNSIPIQQVVRCNFPTTNNEAEYEALIAGVKVA